MGYRVSYVSRNHSGYGLGQQEKVLHSNVSSHWLSSYPEWSLVISKPDLCSMFYIICCALWNVMLYWMPVAKCTLENSVCVKPGLGQPLMVTRCLEVPLLSTLFLERCMFHPLCPMLCIFLKLRSLVHQSSSQCTLGWSANSSVHFTHWGWGR